MGRLPCHPRTPLSKAISARAPDTGPADPLGDRRVSLPDHLTARRSPALNGLVRAPGDKSMSHRALILGAMATGVTEIEGLLEGDDVLATARAVEAFGATVERLGGGAGGSRGGAGSARRPASSTAATPAPGCGC